MSSYTIQASLIRSGAFLLSILGWRKTDECLETGSEIVRVVESAGIGNLFDGEVRLFEQRTSMFDPRGLEKILG